MLSIPKSPARRPDLRTAFARIALCALALGLAACADEPTTPGAGGEEQEGDHTPPRTLGLVEITISGLGTNQVTSSALSAPSVEALERLRAQRTAGAAPGGLVPQDFTLPDDSTGGGDGTIQLELLSTGSFTDGVRGSGGYRYLYATYRVRNAQSDGTVYDTERQNLTFYAVDTDGTNGTIGQTAISRLERFDGSEADASLASQLLPTGAAHRSSPTEIGSSYPDVLQVLTEAEADAIQALADTPPGVVDVFPYGFVVQNPDDPTSRTLRASPAADQFDGVVTFAFKVPLQASPADDPFTVSAIFLATDDDETRITQSLEEQTAEGVAAFDARAAALGAHVLTLLPPAGDAVLRGGETVRVLCDVRVAGAAGAATTTIFPSAGTSPWLVPSPLQAGPFMLPSETRLAAASCSSIASADATTFAVHGFQSGRASGTYDGVGSSFVRAPAGPGGDFFPGEEVEVTLTTALGGTAPVVARYRVAATGGSGTFAGGATYGVGNSPQSVALGDVDGDGDLDLVAVADNGSDNISVLLNQSGGSFGSQATYAVGSAPTSVTLGDVDGDGDLDLATANNSADDVSVLLNQGDGSFGPGSTYGVDNGPLSVALGDVDGDGDLDLATANNSAGNVSVLLNQGDGSFGSHTSYVVGSSPRSLALGDLDGDGDLDLAAANSGADNVSVLLNQGDGSFGSHATYTVESEPRSVALGDLDGDGDVDLVAANNLFNSVSVLLNQGGGSFDSHTSYVVGDSPRSLALGDVDGDGDLDLAVANFGADNVSVLFNQTGGSFGSKSTYAVGDGPVSIALGDVDGDGDLDVVAANARTVTASVLRNQ